MTLTLKERRLSHLARYRGCKEAEWITWALYAEWKAANPLEVIDADALAILLDQDDRQILALAHSAMTQGLPLSTLIRKSVRPSIS